MINKKKVLVIAFTKLNSDPRVYKQISVLQSSGFFVSCIGTQNPLIEGVEFIEINKKNSLLRKIIQGLLLIFRFYKIYYWSLPWVKKSYKSTQNQSFDLIISNDVETLPLAVMLKSRSEFCKLIFDAHEYSPREHDDQFLWVLLFKNFNHTIIKEYGAAADKMLTVCNGIAEEYKKNYNLNAIVITNASNYTEFIPKIGVDTKIRMIHHGASIKSRKIENMIEIMNYLPNWFSLDIMLVKSDLKYHAELEKKVKQTKNIKLIPPVEMGNIVSYISNYDIGLYLLEPSNFNNEMALPNKIFEFIQARLCVAIGPSPEMKRLVDEYKLGVVSKDFLPISLANEIKQLSKEKIFEYKLNASEAAKKLNSEQNKKDLIQIVNILLKE